MDIRCAEIPFVSHLLKPTRFSFDDDLMVIGHGRFGGHICSPNSKLGKCLPYFWQLATGGAEKSISSTSIGSQLVLMSHLQCR